MAYLRVMASQQLIGPVDAEHLRWLLREVEHSESPEITVYVDRSTVELLRSRGAAPELLEVLGTALEGHDDSDLEVLLDTSEHSLHPELSKETSPTTLDVLEDRSPISDVYIGSTRLSCRVCNHGRFRHRRAQMHGALSSFFDIEWASPSADCYICNQCGYVHWFMPV